MLRKVISQTCRSSSAKGGIFGAQKAAPVVARHATTFASTDGTFEKDRIMKNAGGKNTRDFTYFMLGGGRFVYASAARLALIKVREAFRLVHCKCTT